MAPFPRPPSKAISQKTNRKVLAALDHAYRLGVAPNYQLAVHWQWTRFANRDRYEAWKGLIEAVRHWLADRGVKIHAIGVRENPPPRSPAIPSNGEHGQMALHLPLSINVKKLEEYIIRWVGICGEKAGDAVSLTPINDRNLVEKYFMKGGTRQVREHNGVLKKYPANQGPIVGPRVYISDSLNTKAQQDYLGIELAAEVRAFQPLKNNQSKIKTAALK